jgi:hypothetical protein
MQQYDATLKQLFERQARGLLQLLTGSSEVREFLNVEIPQVNVPRLDLLARMADTGRLVNIEFQTTNEEWFLERVGIYYLMSRIRSNGEHVEQMVLYLGKRPLKIQNSLITPTMTFQIRIIDIGDVDGEYLAASGDLGDVLLAVLARVEDRQATIRQALDRIATLDGKERELAIEQLIILAGLRGLEVDVVNEARKYMPFVVDLMENKVFQARYESGLAEGEARGELKVLRAQLNKRFGELPAWAQERLERASAEQLETWSLKLLDAASLDEALGRN